MSCADTIHHITSGELTAFSLFEGDSVMVLIISMAAGVKHSPTTTEGNRVDNALWPMDTIDFETVDGLA